MVEAKKKSSQFIGFKPVCFSAYGSLRQFESPENFMSLLVSNWHYTRKIVKGILSFKGHHLN